MTREEIYDFLMKKCGYLFQSRMAIEEMSELIKELCKLERARDNEEKAKQITQNIIEEIADVLNTVEQLSIYFGKDEVEKVRNEKMERAYLRSCGLKGESNE